jgi:hypothetical protein
VWAIRKASGVLLERINAQNKLELSVGVAFEFDPAKNQMTVKRRGGQRVLTQEK